MSTTPNTAELAATLAHDVGKYVARIARNVAPDGPVPSALVPLLVRDLYELPGGVRASQRFEELAASLPAHASVEAARRALQAIDALESGVRHGDVEACRAACAHAREVERLLREHAREARG